jgi:hypothetical protein
MALQALCWALASSSVFLIFFYTDDRTPWTSDQPVARPLPTHRTTQTQNKRTHTHTPNIHALSGIRTHDPSFRASEDSSCLRTRAHRDRQRRPSDYLNIGSRLVLFELIRWCDCFMFLSLTNDSFSVP